MTSAKATLVGTFTEINKEPGTPTHSNVIDFFFRSASFAILDCLENGSLRGTPRGAAPDCRQARDANFLSRVYPGRAKLITERRVYLAGYRLADLVLRAVGN